MSNSSTDTELDQLIGLGAAKRLVRRLATGDERVHSVLLYGAPGSGKGALARILAKAWLCRHAGEAGACGECKVCLAFDRMVAVDLLVITPKGPSSFIRRTAIVPGKEKEEDISIQEFLRTPPLQAERKVVIIESADRMNRDAANVLLKTLEEPPAYAKILLTTENIGLVLPTVISRCVTMQCEVPPLSTFEDRRVDPRILRAVGGSPGGLKRIESARGWYEAILEFAIELERQPKAATLKVGETFRALCDQRVALCSEGVRAANSEGLKTLANVLERSPRFGPKIKAVVEAHRLVLGNGAPGPIFDTMFAALLS